VRMGGAATLLNAELGYDEAAAEAAAVPAAVLAPTPGSRVQVIWPASRGNAVPTNAEAPDLINLLPNGVRAAMWQLAAAFVLLALWLGRRVGRPVAEPQPVELPASELVVSVGNLLQRARRRDQAAATLAEEARRILAERLGLPASSSAELVADTVAARTGIDRGRVLEALATTTGISDKDLVSRSQTIEEIRREVTRVR
jgi:hypothetical protein